jgi:D-alanyl-lipoteichoic acid acyltransferase DltB (MBOAT superfamily)
MTLTHILILAGASLPFMRLVPGHWRPWGLLAASILALGWFQTGSIPDFSLPTATVILTAAVWWIVQPVAPDAHRRRDTWRALAIIGGALAVLWLALPERPGLDAILPGLGLLCAAGISVTQLAHSRTQADRIEPFRRLALLLIGIIVLVLVVYKSPTLTRFLGAWLTARPADRLAVPLAWLGFSYIAFRLISVLLDYRSGRLPPGGISLRDMAVYVLFFPALAAGPIDRAERFIPDLDQAAPLNAPRFVEGAARIAVGIFKKFIVADSLALVALNPTLIQRTDSAAGLWLLLYLYTFQIFLDFSGYSDVAIGLGRLYGISLPENFDRPYMQRNIQQFWNHWHITLSAWFRIYFFTPLSRALIRRHRRAPQYAIIFAAQISTMFLIGMWHGITLNFALWGLWHGIGLFSYRVLADRTRAWYLRTSQRPWSRRLIAAGSVFATFHFVALGWVFFALPTPHDSLTMLARLFGLGG